MHHAYDRWLDTQNLRAPSGARDGWLQAQQWLYARRAPGNTCLTALNEAREGGNSIQQLGLPAFNDSKGCGGVMRAAPFGLLPADRFSREWAFAAALEAAGYTHGHPTGKLASGALAAIIHEICRGADLSAALDTTQGLLSQHPAHEETSTALAAARSLAASGTKPDPQAVQQLGGGWIAEEALAIGVYAAIVYPQPEQVADALAVAVTHSGDSDSTGAICGNILGALHGETALPPTLVASVEGRGAIVQLADDLVTAFTTSDNPPSADWRIRYPAS